MGRTRLIPLAVASTVLVLALTVTAVVLVGPKARALPPAGSETVNITAEVSVTSRLGSETIDDLAGTARFERGDPYLDGGVEVVDVEITDLQLDGTSLTGPVEVTQSSVNASLGEIRSKQPPPDQFPASSFFDVFINVIVPASPGATLTLHNEDALHFVPMSGGVEVNIDEWPATGVTYEAEPDPVAPCDDGTNNGIPLYPIQPAEVCVTAVSILIGEEKVPTPTPTACPPKICTPTPTVIIPPTPTPPEPLIGPSFSVAPDGPSELSPNGLLGISGSVPEPTPIVVSGNDDFADAWSVAGLPFVGQQNTTGATLESGEPVNPNNCITFLPQEKGATVWYSYTPASTGQVTANTLGSSFDTVLAAYTGNSVNALTVIACDDDTGGVLQSQISFLAMGGTTYYFQAGGFDGLTGNLRLTLVPGSGAGAGTGKFLRISCSNLGLTADGCDGGDGDEDDLDALSFGADFGGSGPPVSFSVAPGSDGLPGTDVADQADCSPPQPQADEFSSELDGTNSLVHDGDGLNSDCPTADPLGLGEEPASDNLDALTAEDASFVDPDLDGVLDEPVFFSLAPGSPSLTPPRDPSDVLWTAGFSPGIYAAGDALGLQAGDDIDGLCVADESPGAPTYEPGSDTVLFSLAAGSPTLTSLGASAADVLAPGPSVRYTAAQLGLQAGDDLDALACGDIAGEVVTVLVGDIWFCSEEFQGGVCDTKVNVGDTVEWDFTPSANIHSTTECGASCDSPTDTPLWDSGIIGPASPDRTFDYTFNEPGVYLYYCTVHPTQQRGRIIVNEPGGLIGDVNCDGLINAIDAALILQLGAGIIDELPCPQNADTNEDGMINAVDAALILQFVAGIIDSLPP